MKKYYFLTAILICLLSVPNLLNAQAPTITSFSPSSGSAGTLVTITGTNLEHTTVFTIGGVSAIVVSDTSVVPGNYGDTLVGLVMPGVATGVVSVTTVGGTAAGSNNFTATATPYPNTQGNQLVGAGTIGNEQQGTSVAISADGNTAIVGGIGDSSFTGATWVYTRSAGAWAQQAKLVGTGAVNTAWQGTSVSISADGNTAIVGGYEDNSVAGAAWVFTRTAGVWTQQGSKLVGTGAVNNPEAARQGSSVSISADGNTAIVGGFGDNTYIGAVWVFTRSAEIWTQQGSKLVGSGVVDTSYQGTSAAISADGNTIIVGGSGDNKSVGAAWVFTRSGGIWTQQGSKLIGTGATGVAGQGSSVSISADGNTALVGGWGDNNSAGASWVFTRTAGKWTQQGSKLVGTGAVNTPWGAEQGTSASISADGNTAIIGGTQDNNGIGAAWVFTRSAGTWTQQGSKLVGWCSYGAIPEQGWSVSISADGNTAIIGGPYGSDDGAWIFSSYVTGIENISNQNSIALYPNPSTGIFNFEIEEEQLPGKEATIEVYNALGQKVIPSFLIPIAIGTNSQFVIDLNGQPTGIYLYRVLAKDGSVIGSGKLVKE